MSIKEKFQRNIKEQIEQLLGSYGIHDTENKLITKDLLLITQQEISSLEKEDDDELCDCGEEIDDSYDPCCSYECWTKTFESIEFDETKT